MKKIVFLAVVIVMIVSTAVNATAESADIKVLTLDEAIKLAVENNRQNVIDDLEIKVKESQLKQAQENADMTGDSYGAERVLESRIRKEVRIMEAQTALEVARLRKEDNRRRTALDVREVFYNILLAEKELDKEMQKLEIQKEKLEFARSRYNTGSLSAEALDEAEFRVISKSADVDNIREKIRTLELRLKILLNMDLDEELPEIKGEIKVELLKDMDIEKIADTRLQFDTSVYEAAGRYNAANRTMQLTEELFRAGQTTYDTNKSNLEKALRDYESALRNREVNIRNSYNDLLNMEDNLELADKYAGLCLKKLDVAKVRYDKGIIDKESYLSAKEAYLDALFSRERARFDYIIRKESFLSMIGQR